MKIHMRPPFPPMPLPPPPKPPPSAFQLEMQAEKLTKAAQQQKDRLKKLYGGRKNRRDLDCDADSETRDQDHHPNRNLNFLA